MLKQREETKKMDKTDWTRKVFIYKKNISRDWKEWLEVETIFKNKGKQGVVGIMRCVDDYKTKFVFKISQYMNYLAPHEYSVMNGLMSISDFCPNYCRPIGIIQCEVDPHSRKGDPFEVKSNHPLVKKDVLLMDYIEDSDMLSNYISTPEISNGVVKSCINQTLMALLIAQKKVEFTHYDLHSSNIMVKKCSRDLVFLYNFGKGMRKCIPSVGYYPIIIDFGFSFVNSMNGGCLWPSMSFTEIGYTSDRFDPISDFKLFLVSIARDIKDKRKGDFSRLFKKIVKKIFGRLPIDWKSGWYELEKPSAATEVMKLINEHNESSELLEEYDFLVVDLLQSLITLPLKNKGIKHMNLSCTMFSSEITKIEDAIGNSYYSLYILKEIMDAARKVREIYNSLGEEKKAVNNFKYAVMEKIDSIVNFCDLSSVSFKKLLLSIYLLSNNIEGIMYTVLNDQQLETDEMCEGLKGESICKKMMNKLHVEYIFNEKTTFCILDVVGEKSEYIQIEEEWIDELNNSIPGELGEKLFGFIGK
jgi:hypothetical protein